MGLVCDQGNEVEKRGRIGEGLTVPVGHVLVRDTRGHVEHDDTAMSVDVVAVAETTEFLLSGGVPDVELDATVVLDRIFY